MTHPGIGVLIGYLGGNSETVDAHLAAKGRTISDATIDHNHDGALELRFVDGTGLRIWDDGRSCCESRYITCDDDLTKLAGEVFAGFELKEGPTTEDRWETHETMFLEVQTEAGITVTLTTHNEHNGYYGGFWPKIEGLPAIAMEARSGETEQFAENAICSGSTEGDSAGPQDIAQPPSGDKS